jgi:AcrR family transcriptional regulator
MRSFAQGSIIRCLPPPISPRPNWASPPDDSDTANVREGILDMAENCIRHIGQRKTNVADIADELNMSRANVHRFFPASEVVDQCLYAPPAGQLSIPFLTFREAMFRSGLSSPRSSKAFTQLIERKTDATDS